MRRFSGEPDLAEVLTDPIVQALMRADGCDLRSLYESIEALREDEAWDWARLAQQQPA